MHRFSHQFLFASLLAMSLFLTTAPSATLAAEEEGGWVHEGMADAGKLTAGFRVGPSFMTQDAGVSTVGPLVNFQGMYGLNNWFRVGMIVEWQNHSVDGSGTGSVNTVSILPINLEYRPGRIGNLIPYVTTGIGVNINTHNVSDTFAWRVGGGLDYALTNWFAGAPKGMMLNVETAWKRNHPSSDASNIGLLFGVRHTF